MITRQLLIDVKRVIQQVDAIRQGRKRHELSEQERALIKEIYNSSYELHELLEHLGFGYRRGMHNKVSYSYDKFFKKLRDETVFLMYYWDGIEEVIRKWDEQDEEDLLWKFEYVYKRGHSREWREVFKKIEKEERSREKKEKEAFINAMRDRPQVINQHSKYEEQEEVREFVKRAKSTKTGKDAGIYRKDILMEFIDYLVDECVYKGKGKVNYNKFYVKMVKSRGGKIDSYQRVTARIRKALIQHLRCRWNTTYGLNKVSFFDPRRLERNKQRNQFYSRYEGKTQKFVYKNLAGFEQTYWEYPVKSYKISG